MRLDDISGLAEQGICQHGCGFVRQLVVVLRVSRLEVSQVIGMRGRDVRMHQMEHALRRRLHVMLVMLVMVVMMLVLLVLTVVLVPRRGAEAHRSCGGERVEDFRHLGWVVARRGRGRVAV